MIHQVRESTNDGARLRELIKLQLQLLGLAATRPTVDRASIESHLFSIYASNASWAAKWVCRQSTLLENLTTFAAHPITSEKLALVGKVRADIELLFTPAPQMLQIAFKCDRRTGTDLPWKCAAGNFCREFYEIWGRSTNPGYPNYLFVRTPITGPSYTRWDYIEGFLAVNNALYLCAICDSTAFRTQVDSRVYTSIEHFFPKSIYPHLAIHPKNLVPICTYCNSTKSDDDLMLLCSATMGIQEFILPYQEHQPGLSQMAYVDISFRGAPSAGSHPLEIKFKPASDFPNAAHFLSHFETLYHVEARWNNELDQIGEQVFRRIQQFLMADVQMGNDLSDVKFLQDRLEMLMALTSRENLGKDPFGMATVWMLKYLVDTLRRERKDALIYGNLVKWAEDHRQAWEGLRKHVSELYTRVPKSTSSL